VNKAVMSMDEGTQQNAALVEQATAAAQSLNEQAASLTQMMARFQVGSGAERMPTSAAEAPSSERRGQQRAFAKVAARPAA
jgi:methyl-accepting chemotaxis protein